MIPKDYDSKENNSEYLNPPYSDYEFSPIPYEALNSRSELPPSGSSPSNLSNFPDGNFPGGNFPGDGSPGGGFPGGSFPGGGFPGGSFPGGGFPGGSFPGGGFPGSGSPGGGPNQAIMPKSPPPNYIPSKQDKGVQSFSASKGTKAVSPSSIRFCLFRFTYIWEVNGRSYWTFLLNVDRRSVSGFRWLGSTWVYFGLDLRRIDSFICYRSDAICESCENLRSNSSSLESTKKEYSLDGTKNIYTKTLTSIDIPEVKEDFIPQTIGYIDDEKICTQVPCLKYRTISYKITLEVNYPDNYDDFLKSKINELSNDASNTAYDVISNSRNNSDYLNPLEKFNISVSLIPEILNKFSVSFNRLINNFNLQQRRGLDINYSIKQEKITTNWQPYSYNITSPF